MPAPDQPPTFTFAKRVLVTTLVVLAVGAVAYFAWRILHVLVLSFAAVLFAILLSAGVDLVRRATKMPRGLALFTVVFVLVLFSWAFGRWLAPHIADQVAEMRRTLPDALLALRDRVAETYIGSMVLERLGGLETLSLEAANVLGRVSGAFTLTLSVLGGVALVVVAGIYLAWNPRQYVRGVIHLLPKNTRPRAEEVLDAVHHALRNWLLARLIAMIVIGVMMGVGLMLLDVPMAIALAVIAGASSFVPIIGFFFAGVLIVFFSLTQGTETTLWVIALYLVVQWIEGNLITPIVEYRAVRVPPALNLVAQLVMALLLGVLGVLFASPLVASAFVVVKMLYVQDILGDTSVEEAEQRRKARRHERVRRAVAALKRALSGRSAPHAHEGGGAG